MKRTISRSALIILIGFIGLIAFGGSAWSADKIVLKYASEYTDKHPTIVNAVMPWIDEVKKLSDGKLEIQFYNPNALAPAREVYSALVDGIVDMVGSPCHWVHGKFPLSTVIQLPLIFNGAEAGSMTIWDIYNKYPEWRAEYKDIQVLWQWTGATFDLHTVKKPIKTLSDLQGMKIIGINPQIRDILKMLGANTIDIPPQDSYLALERGLAEGMAFPIAPMKSFKITDVATYHTIIGAMVDPFFGAMNKEKWGSLPPDLQKILTDTTGGKMARKCGLTLDEGSIKDSDWMKSKGHVFYTLSPEEKLKFSDKIKGMHQAWITEMEEKGIDKAKEIHNEVVLLGQEYSKTTVGGYR